MPVPTTEDIPFPQQAVFDTAVHILPSLGFQVLVADPATSVIEATAAQNYVFSRDRTITMRFVPIDEHWTRMQIMNSVQVWVYDMGTNARDIGKIQVRLMSSLSSTYPTLRATGPPNRAGA